MVHDFVLTAHIFVLHTQICVFVAHLGGKMFVHLRKNSYLCRVNYNKEN